MGPGLPEAAPRDGGVWRPAWPDWAIALVLLALAFGLLAASAWLISLLRPPVGLESAPRTVPFSSPWSTPIELEPTVGPSSRGGRALPAARGVPVPARDATDVARNVADDGPTS